MNLQTKTTFLISHLENLLIPLFIFVVVTEKEFICYLKATTARVEPFIAQSFARSADAE